MIAEEVGQQVAEFVRCFHETAGHGGGRERMACFNVRCFHNAPSGVGQEHFDLSGRLADHQSNEFPAVGENHLRAAELLRHLAIRKQDGLGKVGRP